MEAVAATVSTVVVTSLANLGSYLPQFLGGLVVLLIGLAVAAILREIVLRVLRFVALERWLEKVGQFLTRPGRRPREALLWSDLLAELVRWAVVILFLIPAAEAWGLPRVTEVLNQVLFYLPNVFVATVVGFVGLAVANLTHDVVRNASRGLGSESTNLLANVARYALVFFTALVVLNQLGVASDLVRILFTGVVAMLALAGGLAFGLGGQSTARKALDEFLRRVGR